MDNQSMTGFGRGIVQYDDYETTVQLKSVNYRFREIRFKMPSVLFPLEVKLKKMLNGMIHRGHVDARIDFQDHKNSFDFMDKTKIKEFTQRIEDCSIPDHGLFFNAMDFLKPDFTRNPELNKSLEQAVLDAFDRALGNLVKSRISEGVDLVKQINIHKEKFKEEFLQLKPLLDSFRPKIENRLKTQFSRFDIPVDTPRFMQEIVYYLEKLDITEELDKIHCCIKRMDGLLNRKGEMGREMEFILQEMGRETNTIGSKSSDKNISQIIVNMKIQLEKMREQSLNLE